MYVQALVHCRTECHIQSPRGAFGSDEHHIFETLRPWRGPARHEHARPINGHSHSMTPQTHIHSNPQTLYMHHENHINTMIAIQCGCHHSIHSIAFISISITNTFLFNNSSLYFSKYLQSLFSGFYTPKSQTWTFIITRLCFPMHVPKVMISHLQQ